MPALTSIGALSTAASYLSLQTAGLSFGVLLVIGGVAYITSRPEASGVLDIDAENKKIQLQWKVVSDKIRIKSSNGFELTAPAKSLESPDQMESFRKLVIAFGKAVASTSGLSNSTISMSGIPQLE